MRYKYEIAYTDENGNRQKKKFKLLKSALDFFAKHDKGFIILMRNPNID